MLILFVFSSKKFENLIVSYIKTIRYKMEEQEDYTLYVVVNDDLGMSKGKIASQVGHVVENITTKMAMMLYNYPNNHLSLNYKKYSESGNKKIVLKASQKELEELTNEKDSVYITDAGRTQVALNSLTAVGFLPSNKNKKRFSKLKLL